MFNKMSQRVKQLGIWDIALIKWSVFFATVIIVKLFPQLLRVNYPALIILLVACMLKPMYRFWFKKQ